MTKNIDIMGLTGRVITRESFEYEDSRKMWNRAIEKYPFAIVYCKEAEDVQNAIKWAKAYEIPIRIRSGGHHYEGYSTGNECLVIDVSEMNEIMLSEEKQEVTIGGGVRNRELYEYLGTRDYAFPGGGCPTVGVVGFTLGGGWGYSSRLLGLGCDQLKEVKLINANAEMVIANEKINPSLFWALRGCGGGQFGVIVQMTFHLPPKKEKATLIRLDYQKVTLEEQLCMFEIWQKQIKILDQRANFKLSFYNDHEKGLGILLIGILYGDDKLAHEVIRPFTIMGESVQSLIKTMSVLEVNRWIQDAHPDFEHYKSSGRFVTKDLSKEKMRSFLETIQIRSEGAYYTALSCYGLGGQITSRSPKDMAFYYRKSQYIVGFQTVWADNKYQLVNHEWFNQRFKTIEAETEGSFVNFPLAELKDYEQAYYGEAKEQLVAIKKQYDPDNFFDFPQSIKA